jgi:hypothetical protein
MKQWPPRSVCLLPNEGAAQPFNPADIVFVQVVHNDIRNPSVLRSVEVFQAQADRLPECFHFQ